MSQQAGFVKTTVIGGLFFLAPIVVLLVLVKKGLDIIKPTLAPFQKLIPIESIGGVLVADLVGIVALLMLCFVAGLLARRTRLSQLLIRMEATVLSKLPGYEFMKSMGENMVGMDSRQQHRAVLVRFDDSWQVGFEMERMDDGNVVVLIPGAPAPFSGSVFIMTPDRVRAIDKNPGEALNCQKAMGIGTNRLLGGRVEP